MSDCSRSECIGGFPDFSGWWQAGSGGGVPGAMAGVADAVSSLRGPV